MIKDQSERSIPDGRMTKTKIQTVFVVAPTTNEANNNKTYVNDKCKKCIFELILIDWKIYYVIKM